MTSRGCPYSCSFCYLTVFKERKYRTIPCDTILEDLDAIKNNYAVIVTGENFIGYSEKDFEDRKILLEKVIRKNYRFRWGCQSTTALATQPELMELMYRSECRAVFIGFESVEEEGLNQYERTITSGLITRRSSPNFTTIILRSSPPPYSAWIPTPRIIPNSS